MDDLEFQDLLYAKMVRSMRTRGKIVSIDIPKLPEGYFIVDKNDVSGINRVKIIADDQPFFAEDEVNYIGESILLVVGPDRKVISDIVCKIVITYEEIPSILSIEDAEKGDKPPIYGKDNYFANYEYKKGNIDEIIKNNSNYIEDEFITRHQEHLYLENQGMTAVYEEGNIKIYGSMQCPYYITDAVSRELGWEKDRVRTIQAVTGGGFGGKEEYPSLMAGQVAFAALKTKKTVKLELNRDEDIMCTTKRHPSIIKIRTYLDLDNEIEGMDIEIKLEGGAYSGLSDSVLKRAIFSAAGVYNIKNLRVRGKAVATNKVVSSALRGFGGPQACFAIEMHMANIAKKLGIDPLELKKKYILRNGDTSSTGGVFLGNIVLDKMIEEVEKISEYKKRRKKNKDKKDKLTGIGCSLFYHGAGFVGNDEKNILKSKVKLKKYSNNKVEIFVANVDMGQGAATTLRKIVAYTLRIPIADVIYENPDTNRVPDSGPTAASRTIVIVGKLLEEAAVEMRRKWNNSLQFEVEKVYKPAEGIKWNDEKLEGNAYTSYSWGANVVEVEVNPITLQVKVKGIWGVYDIGKAIDEKIIRGQIEGGLVQGLGYGSMEFMDISRGGIIQNDLLKYMIPCSKEFSKIKIKLIDNPYPNGPFGAKGAGELPFVGAAPAFALAVEDALGKHIKELPVTPEYLMKVVNNKNDD